MTDRGSLDDGAGDGDLRRQAARLARTWLRPGAYVGAAREVSLSAFHVATYPLGLLPGVRRDRPVPGSRSPDPQGNELLPSDAATADSPVILVHGYFHNRSAFLVMARALRRAGFRNVRTLGYRPLVGGLPEAAGLLAEEVDDALATSSAPRCQIVGHSMGGLIARYYVQELGGARTVDTVITLGTPHRGTWTSYFGVGPAAAQLRPGSAFLRRLEETARPGPVRWVAYHSDLDLTIVPSSSAKLVHPALDAVNIAVRDTGHLSLLLSGEVLRGVITHLANRDVDRPRRAAFGPEEAASS